MPCNKGPKGHGGMKRNRHSGKTAAEKKVARKERMKRVGKAAKEAGKDMGTQAQADASSREARAASMAAEGRQYRDRMQMSQPGRAQQLLKAKTVR